jgi:CheY-like chemotaxis protein
MATPMEKDQSTLVLVADDEPSTLALVASHVRSKGFQVIEASDGDQAWQLAYENLPDLIILDVMMPGMSGWEVCRKVREAVSLAHTGVIMLTGIGENLNEMTSPLYGADTYIDKPFQFYDLDAKIDETLKKRRESDAPHEDDDAVDDDDDDAPPDSGTVPSNSTWAQRTGAGDAEPEEKPTLKVPSTPGPKKVATPKTTAKAKTAKKPKPAAKKRKAKVKPAKKKAASKKKAKAKKAAKPAKKKAKAKPAKKKAASKKKAKAKPAKKKTASKKKSRPAKKKTKAKKAARKAPKAKRKPSRKK